MRNENMNANRNSEMVSGSIISALYSKKSQKSAKSARVEGFRPQFFWQEEHLMHLQEAVQLVERRQLVKLVADDGSIWNSNHSVLPIRLDRSAETFSFICLDKNGHAYQGQGPVSSILTPTLAARLAEMQENLAEMQEN